MAHLDFKGANNTDYDEGEEDEDKYRDSLFGMNKMDANPEGANNTSFMYKAEKTTDPVA